jgi:hypothetical protein
MPAAPDRRLLVLLLAAAAFWSWLAFGVHTVEIIGGELDQYVVRARAILAGSDNKDPYHPAGYPLWIAALGWCGVEPFAAARALGVGFGLVLLWASHGLARLWLPPGASLLVATIVGLSEFVVTTTVQACSDVPAAAMGAVALLHWCRATRDGVTTRRLVLGGLALGIATSFRSPALWLGAGFLPLLWNVAPAHPVRERLRRVGWTALSLVVGQLPHFVWFAHVFGSPLHNLAWHSLVLKFHCHYDEPQWIAAAPRYDEILRAEWTSWLWPAARDALHYLGSGFANGLGVGVATAPAIALSLAVLAGLLHALWRGDRARVALALATLCYASLLAATFRPMDRFTIPQVLPAVLALAVPFVRRDDARRATAVLLLLLAVVALRAAEVLRGFPLLHAHAERAAVAELGAERGEPARALVWPFFAFVGDDPWTELRRHLHAYDQEFAVLSRTTSRPAIDALLARPLPPDFAIVRNDELLVLDATQTPTPWLAAASATPRDGTLQLQLERTATAPSDDPILMAAFLVGAPRAGAIDWQHVPLLPTGERSYAFDLPAGALRGLRCRFVPAVIHASGMIRRGTPFEVTP